MAKRGKRSGTQASGSVSVQVYVPHRAGLPPLKPYFRDLIQRRHFAAAFSRANIRAANVQTLFGQLWLVLNPLLLALVYYLLVAIINDSGRGIEFLAHLTGGLFLFTLIAASIQTGAQSITGGGRLILNISFPRLLMPLAAVRTAFFRFLPTLPVYLALRLVAGDSWGWEMLVGLYFLGAAIVFSAGLAALFATLQVYFRDATSFLPYFTRIWLYASPILWFPTDPGADMLRWLELNPLYYIVGGWTTTTLTSDIPDAKFFILAAVWALVSVLVGFGAFMTRERDFAVRI